MGVDGGSQGVVVSNSTFTDISGGGIKLGYSGERGVTQPQNNESFPVELQVNAAEHTLPSTPPHVA